MFNIDAFKRTGTNHEVSASTFNLIMGAVLLWGFALNWFMVTTIPVAAIKAINPVVFIIGYLICAVAGTWIMAKSENPIVSFFGYNMITVPVGLVLVMVIPGHSHEHIVAAVQTTALLTVAMMCLATLFPRFFRNIGPALFWALLLSIVVELIQMIFFKVKLGIMDWIVAAIFCGYIGYDWGRANSIERTVDNAIDSAAALYLDIINIFLRDLSITSKS
jgi:FtsH-binding integral membrane protein